MAAYVLRARTLQERPRADWSVLDLALCGVLDPRGGHVPAGAVQLAAAATSGSTNGSGATASTSTSTSGAARARSPLAAPAQQQQALLP